MVRKIDMDFVNSIGEEVYKQQDINDMDFSVVITKDQIKENTNRKAVRGVILDEYAEALGTMTGVTASVQNNRVVIEAKSEVNQIFKEKYNSLEDLRNTNTSMLDEED